MGIILSGEDVIGIYTDIITETKQDLTKAIASRKLSEFQSLFIDAKELLASYQVEMNKLQIEYNNKEEESKEKPIIEWSEEESEDIKDVMDKMSTLLSTHQEFLDKIDEVIKLELIDEEKIDKIIALLK